MAWSYEETDLTTTTDTGRLNSVRLLVGDTDENDQLIQDEEILFGLAQVNNNIYFAASFAADAISAKFTRRVTTKIDGALSANYSELAKRYKALSQDLKEQGQRYSMTSTSFRAGGISKTEIKTNQSLTDRPPTAFSRGQFDSTTSDNQYIRDND